MCPDPVKKFNKIFREKAHPEAKILEEVQAIRELQFAVHENLTKQINEKNSDIENYFEAIQEDIEELTEKVDVILDIKKLKEKVENL